MSKTKKQTEQVVSVNAINPVDYYNKHYVEHTIELLCKKVKPIQRVGVKALTYIKNRSDKTKRMIIIDPETGTFEAELPNGLNMPVGEKHTAFMMLQKYIYKNNWHIASNYVIYELMNNNNEYMRIKTDYYVRSEKVDRYGIKRNIIEPWTRQAILDDHDKAFLGTVEKYRGFTIIPDNKDYIQIDGGYWNLYSKFTHKAATKKEYSGEEDWKWIGILIKHIFGEQYEMGLIYLKALYEYPKQALPILVLISEERQTGKTTFVNLLSLIFGSNTVIINPQDIGSAFNATYAEKNIIMIEESHFDSRQALEKIKNLSTQNEISVNQKFVNQKTIPFFGKIIITSNDETKFSKVDDMEIRYWVRKIPTLEGKANHSILEDMKNEIPYFLYFLESLGSIEGKHQKWLNGDGSIDTSASRMVFTNTELQTEALASVKKESRESLHKDIEIYLDNHGMQNQDIKEFMFISINIKEKYFNHNQRYTTSYINRVLKNSMKLEKIDSPTRFVPIEDSRDLSQESMVGRPYVYKNKFYNPDVKEQSDDDLDIPF